MSDTKQLISSLDDKVNQLVSKVKQGRLVLESKEKELEVLKKNVTVQLEGLEKLRAENEVLKSSPIETSANSEDVKVKIDGLVKEIDKCISLLKV